MSKFEYETMIYTCEVCGDEIETDDEDDTVVCICPDCLDEQALDYGYFDDDPEY